MNLFFAVEPAGPVGAVNAELVEMMGSQALVVVAYIGAGIAAGLTIWALNFGVRAAIWQLKCMSYERKYL